MHVGECCNKTVIATERSTDVGDVARLMREYHVGSIVVVESNGEDKPRPVGIVTDRDIVVEVTAAGMSTEGLTAGDIMGDDLLTAGGSDDLVETLERMREAGVRRVPVVNAEGRLTGILTMDDVLEVLIDALGLLPHLVHQERYTEADRRP